MVVLPFILTSEDLLSRFSNQLITSTFLRKSASTSGGCGFNSSVNKQVGGN